MVVFIDDHTIYTSKKITNYPQVLNPFVKCYEN